jgi:carboxyl-terminal processing protease
MSQTDPRHHQPDPETSLDDPPPERDGGPTLHSRRRPILALSLALIAILAGSALFLSGYTLGRQAASQPGTPPSVAGAFQPFWDTYQTIIDRYAGGPVDREALIQGAIRGMIAALGDPYSAYLSADQYRQSLQGISGQFEGIGAEIASQAADGTQGCTPLGPACHLVITKPIDGSPAQRAGVQAGDLVSAVDGTSLEGLTLDAAIAKIRGPRGSLVTLTIERGGAPPIQLAITRDVVQTLEVESQALAGETVGYVKLSGFSDAAADDFVKALSSHITAGRTKLILDLRGDPGGYVTAARKIASQFIGSGVLFWEQDAQGNQVPSDALGDGVATNPAVRLAVLIDGGTASASEIVAGALQDSGRATLVGQQSFGKGTVQEWQQLTGEGGAFKLTIARWLTPAKRWINGTGLTPDLLVSLPNPIPAGTDPDLDRALELLGAAPSGSVLRVAA